MKTSKPLLSNKIEDINSKLNQEQLNTFTADCLKKYCKENSIPIATTKANLIINLIEHFNNNKSTSTSTSTSTNNNNNKQPLNDSSNIQQPIQQQEPLKMKSILKKDTANKDNKENKENIKEIIDKVESLTISKNENVNKSTIMTTRRKALENQQQQQQQQQQQEKEKEQGNKKKVTFNSVNQIGFVERKEKNNYKYYINTNQNSPIKNESPLKIVNNQSYNIFDFIGKEEEEFDTDNMKIWELKEALETNGLSIEGDKQQLKERLEKFIVETLNKSNNENNENDQLNDSIDDDWIRWTPLKAKNSKVSSTSTNDRIKSSKTTKKIIKSKSKPSKKSKKDQDDDSASDQDESYDDDDDDDEDKDTPIMTSQQLFNAFIDVSVSSNKKKK